ncbi:MAG: HPP family protein [Gammaproteobacteria bacterium]|nr:HPP family protein [Gammaproteobacteria bacterium]MCB1817643.1 HPP family protein [Gammaproteobacteria bacterium]MCP5318479.1 HPP family protein [Chromatiaceae bacterium]HOP15303.1 HPP family protein [Gammaproteobacteria bacterium]HPQ25031.1 HPP family protein [Gammaproteobacteria bacterium]
MTEQPPVSKDPNPVPDAEHPAHARTKPAIGQAPRPRISVLQILVAWLGAFAGIALIGAAVDLLPRLNLLIVGSFGASAVLLYGAPRAPLSQPRNLIGGHMVSALVGVACYRYLPDVSVLQEAAAVASAIALMMATRTIHPPGGATALIAVIGGEQVHALGWGYVFPVLIGALVMLVVALVSNNLYEAGSYPDRWD